MIATTTSAVLVLCENPSCPAGESADIQPTAYAFEAEALDPMLGPAAEGWPLLFDGDQLCRQCCVESDCVENGHQWSQLRSARTPGADLELGVLLRWCSHCGALDTHILDPEGRSR